MQQMTKSTSEKQSQSLDGIDVAKTVKYWLHLQNPYSSRSVPISQVQAKSLYNEHRSIFDNAANVFNKY